MMDSILKRNNLVAFGAIVLLVFLAYSNTFDAAWHMDDYDNILNNTAVHLERMDKASLRQAVGNTREGGANLPRPVANLSFALNWYFGGENVVGYHIVNIIIHLFCALLLFQTLLVLSDTPRFPSRLKDRCYAISLTAALLWALNPLQTQAVTFIVQRMASMAAFFYLASFYAYLKGRMTPAHRRRIGWWSLSFLCWVLGIGSKQNAVLAPMAILLAEATFFEGYSFKKDTAKIILPLVGLTALMIGVVFYFSNSQLITKILSGYDNRPFSLTERLLTQPRVLIFYLSQLFYPIPQRLSLEHEINFSVDLFHPWTTLPALLVLILLATAGLRLMRRRPLVSFAILFFLMNHVIESSFIPLEMIFEHRNYLPSLFVFWPVAAGLLTLSDKRPRSPITSPKAITGAIVCLVLLLTTATYTRNQVWKTERSLWADAARKAPSHARPIINLAIDHRRAGRMDTALAMYEQSLSLFHPRKHHFRILALNNMGGIKYAAGQYQEASQYYRRALRIDPKNPNARYNLSLTFFEMGRYEDAEHEIEVLLSDGQESVGSLNLQGLLMVKQRRPGDAIPYLRRSLAIAPWNRGALINLGLAHSQMKHYRKADWFYRRANHTGGNFLIGDLCRLENSIHLTDRAYREMISRILQTYSLSALRDVLRDATNEIGHPEKVFSYLTNAIFPEQGGRGLLLQ